MSTRTLPTKNQNSNSWCLCHVYLPCHVMCFHPSPFASAAAVLFNPWQKCHPSCVWDPSPIYCEVVFHFDCDSATALRASAFACVMRRLSYFILPRGKGMNRLNGFRTYITLSHLFHIGSFANAQVVHSRVHIVRILLQLFLFPILFHLALGFCLRLCFRCGFGLWGRLHGCCFGLWRPLHGCCLTFWGSLHGCCLGLGPPTPTRWNHGASLTTQP